MPQTFRGKAQVTGTAFACNVILYPWPETIRSTHEFEEDKIQNTIGDDYSWRARNEMIMGDLGMIFVDQSVSSTKANAQAGMAYFAPYAILTISGCDAAVYNTTWQVVSGSTMDQKNTDPAKGTFRIRRYTDAAQNALAATTPG